MSDLELLKARVDALELAAGLKLPDKHDLAIRKLLNAIHYRSNSVRMLSILLKRDFMSTEGMSIALGGASKASLKVYVSNIRKALKPYNIHIITEGGEGWRLSSAGKSKLRAVLRDLVEDAAPSSRSPASPALQSLINAGMA